jgi:hypothetical protein
MQITLTDEQYNQLRDRSRMTGSSIAELVRRRIDTEDPDADARARALAAIVPSPLTTEEKLAAIRESEGIWKDDGDEVYQQWHRMRGHDLLDQGDSPR